MARHTNCSVASVWPCVKVRIWSTNSRTIRILPSCRGRSSRACSPPSSLDPWAISAGSVQWLGSAFRVDAGHHHVIRRIDVKPCNIVDFLDEEGIRGQRQGLGPLRVDAEQAEPVGRGTDLDALDRTHAVGAPVGGVGGWSCKPLWITAATRLASEVRGRTGRSSSCRPWVPPLR